MVTNFEPVGGGGETEEEKRRRLERERLAIEAGGFLPGPPQDVPTFTVPAAPSPVAAGPAPARLPPVFARPEPAEQGGFLPFEEPIQDYEDEPFTLDTPDQPFFPTGEEPDPFFDFQIPAPEDEPFSLDDLDIPAPRVSDEVEPEIPPPDETFIIDTLAQEQIPAPDTTFTIEADERPEGQHLVMDQALTETLDLLRFDGLNPFVEDIADPRRRRLPPVIERPEPDEYGVPGGEGFITPTTTIDTLAQLPQGVFDDFGQFAGAAPYQQLQPIARDLVTARDQPDFTVDDLRRELLSRNPSIDPAAIETALLNPDAQAFITAEQERRQGARDLAPRVIEELNTRIGVQQMGERANALLLDREREAAEGQRVTAAGASNQGNDIPGRLRDGVFVPERQLSWEEVPRVYDSLTQQGIEVREVESGGGRIRPLEAVESAAQAVFGVARDANLLERTTGIQYKGTTLIDQVMDLGSYTLDRSKEQVVRAIEAGLLENMAVFIGGGPGPAQETLQRSLVPPGTAEFRTELKKLPAGQKDDLAPSIYSIWLGGNLNEAATDLSQGVAPKDVAQKYHNIWVELGADMFTDPLNLVVPAFNVLKAGAGLHTASGLIDLNGLVVNHAARQAIEHIPDAQAIAPWDDAAIRGMLAPQRAREVGGGTDIAGTLLGNASAQARASTARVTANSVMNFMQGQAVTTVGDQMVLDAGKLDGWFRDLATLGGDATSIKPDRLGLAATRDVQTARFTAPDVLKALDTPESGLRQALDKPVYQGQLPWNQLDSAGKKAAGKVYGSETERTATVLGALQETVNRASRVHLGLDPFKTQGADAVQGIYRGVLSNVYLFNPRYYIRNATGDMVSAFERGLSAWANPNKLHEFNLSVGRAKGFAGIDPSGTVRSDQTGISRFNLPGKLKARLATGEGGRKDTIYMYQHGKTLMPLRKASVDDGWDALGALPQTRPDVAKFLRGGVLGAQRPADLDAMKLTRGSIANWRPRVDQMLDDLNPGDMLPGLKMQLDSVVGRAVREQGFNSDAAFAKLLDEAAANATENAKHLGDVSTTADDLRRVKDEVEALVANGTPRPQALAESIARFGEVHHRNARIAQAEQELTERLKDQKLFRMFGPEYRKIQSDADVLRRDARASTASLREAAINAPPAEKSARWNDYFQQTSAKWDAYGAGRTGPLDALLVKVRTAQNGTGMGGPKVANGFKSVDEMTAKLEADITNLRGQIDAVDVVNPSAVFGGPSPAAAPEPKLPAALAGAKENYNYGPKRFALAFDSDVDRAAFIARNPQRVSRNDAAYLKFVMNATGKDEQLSRLYGQLIAGRIKDMAKDAPAGTLLRIPSSSAPGRVAAAATPPTTVGQDIQAMRRQLADAEDALANLRGQGSTAPVKDMAGPTAATVAAAQAAKEALYILHTADRLPGVLDEIKAARAAVRDLSPGQIRDVNKYLDAQKANLNRDRIAADAAATGMANWVLHNYDRTYDFDYWLRWVSPWELWTSRTFAKLPLRVADHPAYFSKIDILREEMQEAADKTLPEYMRDLVKIPIPGLPKWAGDQLFFDPVKIGLPTDLMDNYQREEEDSSSIAKARAMAGYFNQSPGPIADMALTLLSSKVGGESKAPWWESQRRSPLADAWTPVASLINKMTGTDLAIRPIVGQQDVKEAYRQLGQMVDRDEITGEQAQEAREAIARYVSTGFSLTKPDLKNDTAQQALDRALTRVTVKGGLSSGLALLSPQLETEAERNLYALQDQYFKVRDGEGKDAARAFITAHPELESWFGTGNNPAEMLQSIALNKWYDGRQAIYDERQRQLDALPFMGTDIDRQRIYDETQRKLTEYETGIKDQYAGFSPPEGREPSMAAHLARLIQDIQPARDSNGVKDWDEAFKRRDQALNAFERAPVTIGTDQIDATQDARNLVPAIQEAMQASTVDSAAKRVVEAMYHEARDQQTKAAAAATTREEATRVRQEFERTWRTPDNNAIADRVMAENPGKFTREAILKELDASIPQSLSAFAQLNEAERVGKFQAGLDPKGVSTEPFYVDKNNGVSPIVVKTAQDLEAWRKAKADDAQYQTRRGANDPTYVNFDTEGRQRWLFGGEAGAALWRVEQSVLQYALGPVDPVSGQRQGGGKGWTAEYRFPDGTKMKAIEAYQMVNKEQDKLATAQSAGGTRLPSEKPPAASQTQQANSGSRSTARSSGSRTSYSRTSGSRGGGGTRATADPGPRPGAVTWFDDGKLRKAELLKPDTDLNEEWRKGLGMTPETFARFTGKHGDVVNAINEMERLRGGLFEAGADQNAITTAVQEQALKVNEALVKARALEAERKAGPTVPTIANLPQEGSTLRARELRQGKVDVNNLFRQGTSGYSDAAKWEAFKARYPSLSAEITRLQAAAEGFKTDDESPDDLVPMSAYYDEVARVGDRINEAKRADAERKAGPPLPSINGVTERYMKPDQLRGGFTATNLERAFRVGTVAADVDWAGFKARNPEVGQAIAALEKDATALKTADEYPDDAARITAFYDAVANVSSIIAGAKEADARKEAEAKRAISEAATAKAREASEARTARLRAEAEAERVARRQRDDAYYDARRQQRSSASSAASSTSNRPSTTSRGNDAPSRLQVTPLDESLRNNPRYAALFMEGNVDEALADLMAGRKRTRRGRRGGRRGGDGE